MPKKSLDTITEAESIKLLAQRMTQRNKVLILLMLDAGLRVGEVVQLRRSDLWFNNEVRENLIVRAAITKTDSERTIPLSVRLKQTIHIYASLSRWPFYPDPSNYAFQGRYQNTHLRRRSVQIMVECMAIESLGRRIHPHQLRHTFATRLMQNTNIRIVQELLGHKHLTSTQVYMHPNHKDLTDAIKSINR